MARVLLAASAAFPAVQGAEIVREHVALSGMQCGWPTSQDGVVAYLKGANVPKRPLISYSHGWTDGGDNLYKYYQKLWPLLINAGYVILAQEAPAGTTYCDDEWKDQLRLVEWARTEAPANVSDLIDWNLPISVVGHSMGGRATVISSSQGDRLKELGIKVAVAQHPSTNVDGCGPGCDPAVPILFTTGQLDTTVPPAEVKRDYDNTKGVPKAFVNMKGAGHLDPKTEGDLQGNYVVDWLNCFVKQNNTACHMATCQEPQETSPTVACQHEGIPSAVTV